MKTLLLHHNDLDGYTAGILAMLAYPRAEARPMNYAKGGTPLEQKDFEEYDTVVVVDYSLPGELMLWLMENRNLIWIDHHYSAICQSRKMGYDRAEGLRCPPEEFICGAELAWKYFHPQLPIPRFLRLVGDYDTFRNSQSQAFQQEVLPFFYASQLEMDNLLPRRFSEPGFPLKSVEDFQQEERCEEWIRKGKVIQAYNQDYYTRIGKEFSFVRNLWGLRVLCLNCPGHGSLNIKPSFRPLEHDAMLQFAFNGSGWSYGLYTDTFLKPQVDCSAIAKEFGGGGHRGAAGFSTPVLLPGLLE